MYTSVLIESLCIEEDWIDDTIEIRIIILVEIFVGTKRHSEKKKTPTGSMNIKIQMIPLPRPREMSAVRSECEITNLSFLKNKMESKPSPINVIIRKNYREEILF